MNRKLIAGLASAVTVGALLTGGTYAYYSDNESSGSQSIRGTAMDLVMGNQASVVFSTEDVAPGYLTTRYLTVTNSTTDVGAGVIGNLSLSFPQTLDNENGCAEPEIEVGDVSCGSEDNPNGTGQGELDSNFRIAVREVVTANGGGAIGGPWVNDFVADLNAKGPRVVNVGTLAPGQSRHFRIRYDVSTDVGNSIMGDGVGFTILAELDQQLIS
jgi:predicted ribosomally synthesized peptide with SipW-like signal peptide